MDSILTVTTPAADQDLTTLATVKAELGITGTDDDTYLARLITEASDTCARYCGRVFAEQTYTEVWRPCGAVGKLKLSRWPVGSITSATVDGTALDATGYEVNGALGFLYRLSDDVRRGWSGQKITIVYVAGFSAIPADLEAVAIEMVTGAYRAKGRDPALRSIDVPDVATETYWVPNAADAVGGLPPDLAARLDRYREWVI